MGIYAITENGSDKVRLVEANSKAQAIGYCARNKFTATTCRTNDIAKFMRQGLQLESADSQQDEQK